MKKIILSFVYICLLSISAYSHEVDLSDFIFAKNQESYLSYNFETSEFYFGKDGELFELESDISFQDVESLEAFLDQNGKFKIHFDTDGIPFKLSHKFLMLGGGNGKDGADCRGNGCRAGNGGNGTNGGNGGRGGDCHGMGCRAGNGGHGGHGSNGRNGGNGGNGGNAHGFGGRGGNGGNGGNASGGGNGGNGGHGGHGG